MWNEIFEKISWLIKRQRYQEALQEIILLEKEFPEAIYQAAMLRASAFYYLKQYHKAKEQALIAMKEDPECTRTRALLAEIYVQQKNYNQAKKLLEEAVKLEPNNSDVLVYLSRFYLHRGYAQLARKPAELALSMQISVLTLETMCRIEITEGHLQKARHYLHKALEKEPESPSLLFLNHLIKYRSGEFEGQSADMLEILRLNPNSEFYQNALLKSYPSDLKSYRFYLRMLLVLRENADRRVLLFFLPFFLFFISGMITDLWQMSALILVGWFYLLPSILIHYEPLVWRKLYTNPRIKNIMPATLRRLAFVSPFSLGLLVLSLITLIIFPHVYTLIIAIVCSTIGFASIGFYLSASLIGEVKPVYPIFLGLILLLVGWKVPQLSAFFLGILISPFIGLGIRAFYQHLQLGKPIINSKS